MTQTSTAAGNRADWTITWTLEPEGEGTRLFLVAPACSWFTRASTPATRPSGTIMGGGWSSGVMPTLKDVLDTI
jgi:hypothetical protein